MKRRVLFEFNDQRWLPKIIRWGITDYLKFISDNFFLYKKVITQIKLLLDKTSNRTIVDLGSGSGGGMIRLSKELKELEVSHRIILTDKYPNVEAFNWAWLATNANIQCVQNSVDALNVPKSLIGIRTFFASFHHFNPIEAEALLRDAVLSRSSIGVFEITERTYKSILLSLLVPLVVIVSVFFSKSIKLRNIVLLPILILVITWDYFVSVLRSYTETELLEMTKDLLFYNWEVNKVKAGLINVTYLIGYEREKEY